MAKINKASANWSGGLKDGKGFLSTARGALNNVPYSFKDRFEDGTGTNPEEMIGAAHAACFAMALSGDLEKAGHKADRIDAEDQVTLDFIEGKPTVTKIHLVVSVKAAGLSESELKTIVEGTKENCPISRLLKTGTAISAEAKLVS